MYTTTEIHIDDSPAVKTTPPPRTYRMVERGYKWLNLAGCSVASLRIMMSSSSQKSLLTLGE
jgi:hypothetical protein